MQGETLAEIINIIIQVLAVLSCFFAGWLLAHEDRALFALALFLFIFGVLFVVVRVKYEEEIEEGIEE